ncbi:MAG: radical SAM protein [Elusimicrobia bacterium]|nr:radical SAM protein [Candidatus Liberimonas magnetica]
MIKNNLKTIINFKKVTAVLTALCFTFSFIIGQPLQAALEQRKTSKDFKEIFDGLLIPVNYGKITETYSADNVERRETEKNNYPLNAKRSTLVVNIQDLHCHPEVQKNISNIISILDKKYNLKKVYIEGVSGSIDTSWLTNVKNEDLKKKVLDTLLESGKLSGAEYYSATSGKNDILYGVDDRALHTSNIIRLAKIQAKQNEIQSKVDELARQVSELRDVYYGSGNKKLDKLIEKNRLGKIKPKKYYSKLLEFAQDQNISLKKSNNLTEFTKIFEVQSKINYKQVSKELQVFIVLLKAKLPYSSYNMLATYTGNFSQPNQLYVYLSRIAKRFGPSVMQDFPNLNKFFEYLEVTQNINPILLIDEEHNLINEIRLRLARTKSEREVVFLNEFIRNFKDYLAYKSSTKDYEYIRANTEQFKYLWVKYVKNEELTGIQEYFDLLNEYYAANFLRNNCLIANCGILQTTDYRPQTTDHRPQTTGMPVNEGIALLPLAMVPSDALENATEVIVLITGGFHTAGLSELLKERGVPYLVVTPNVTQNTGLAESVYAKLLEYQSQMLLEQQIVDNRPQTADHRPQTKYFEGKNSGLSGLALIILSALGLHERADEIADDLMQMMIKNKLTPEQINLIFNELFKDLNVDTAKTGIFISDDGLKLSYNYLDNSKAEKTASIAYTKEGKRKPESIQAKPKTAQEHRSQKAILKEAETYTTTVLGMEVPEQLSSVVKSAQQEVINAVGLRYIIRSFLKNLRLPSIKDTDEWIVRILNSLFISSNSVKWRRDREIDPLAAKGMYNLKIAAITNAVLKDKKSFFDLFFHTPGQTPDDISADVRVVKAHAMPREDGSPGFFMFNPEGSMREPKKVFEVTEGFLQTLKLEDDGSCPFIDIVVEYEKCRFLAFDEPTSEIGRAFSSYLLKENKNMSLQEAKLPENRTVAHFHGFVNYIAELAKIEPENQLVKGYGHLAGLQRKIDEYTKAQMSASSLVKNKIESFKNRLKFAKQSLDELWTVLFGSYEKKRAMLLDTGKQSFRFYRDMVNEAGSQLPPDNVTLEGDIISGVDYRTSTTNIGKYMLALPNNVKLWHTLMQEEFAKIAGKEKVVDFIKFLQANGIMNNDYRFKDIPLKDLEDLLKGSPYQKQVKKIYEKIHWAINEQKDYITQTEMLNRLKMTLKSIERMPKHTTTIVRNGEELDVEHLYNWYYIREENGHKALEPQGLYISAVDNGNFAASLMNVVSALEAMEGTEAAAERKLIINQCNDIIKKMRFDVFWEEQIVMKELFSYISRRIDTARLTHDWKTNLNNKQEIKDKINHYLGLLEKDFFGNRDEILNFIEKDISAFVDKEMPGYAAEVKTHITRALDYNYLMRMGGNEAIAGSLLDAIEGIKKGKEGKDVDVFKVLCQKGYMAGDGNFPGYFLVQPKFAEVKNKYEDFRVSLENDFNPDQIREIFEVLKSKSEIYLQKARYDRTLSEAMNAYVVAIELGHIPDNALNHTIFRSWFGTMFEQMTRRIFMDTDDSPIGDKDVELIEAQLKEKIGGVLIARFGKRFGRFLENRPFIGFILTLISGSHWAKSECNALTKDGYAAYGNWEIAEDQNDFINVDVSASYALYMAMLMAKRMGTNRILNAVVRGQWNLKRHNMNCRFGYYEACQVIERKTLGIFINFTYGIVNQVYAHHTGMMYMALVNFFTNDINVEWFKAYVKNHGATGVKPLEKIFETPAEKYHDPEKDKESADTEDKEKRVLVGNAKFFGDAKNPIGLICYGNSNALGYNNVVDIKDIGTGEVYTVGAAEPEIVWGEGDKKGYIYYNYSFPVKGSEKKFKVTVRICYDKKESVQEREYSLTPPKDMNIDYTAMMEWIMGNVDSWETHRTYHEMFIWTWCKQGLYHLLLPLRKVPGFRGQRFRGFLSILNMTTPGSGYIMSRQRTLQGEQEEQPYGFICFGGKDGSLFDGFDTDRMTLYGRLRSILFPKSVETGKFAGNQGYSLAPAAGLNRKGVFIKAGETYKFSVLIGLGQNEREVSRIVKRCREQGITERATENPLNSNYKPPLELAKMVAGFCKRLKRSVRLMPNKPDSEFEVFKNSLKIQYGIEKGKGKTVAAHILAQLLNTGYEDLSKLADAEIAKRLSENQIDEKRVQKVFRGIINSPDISIVEEILGRGINELRNNASRSDKTALDKLIEDLISKSAYDLSDFYDSTEDGGRVLRNEIKDLLKNIINSKDGKIPQKQLRSLKQQALNALYPYNPTAPVYRFTQEGRVCIVRKPRSTKKPWAYPDSNGRMGFVATVAGAFFSFSGSSVLKQSMWNPNIVTENVVTGLMVNITDENGKKIGDFSLTPHPQPSSNVTYETRVTPGKIEYITKAIDGSFTITVTRFVSKYEPVSFAKVDIKYNGEAERKFAVSSFNKWEGQDLVVNFDEQQGTLDIESRSGDTMLTGFHRMIGDKKAQEDDTFTEYSSSKFLIGELDYNGIMDQLRNEKRSHNDKVVIAELFGCLTREVDEMSNEEILKYLKNIYEEALVDAFNRLMDRQNLPDEIAYKHEKLRPQIQELLDTYKEISKDRLSLETKLAPFSKELNRALLQAAFPEGARRSYSGNDDFAGLRTEVSLSKDKQSSHFAFMYGQIYKGDDVQRKQEARDIIEKFKTEDTIDKELEERTAYLKKKLFSFKIHTPNANLNYMVNYWLPYQMYLVHIYARAALYQASGGYGFRDQAQSYLGLLQSGNWQLGHETYAYIKDLCAHQFETGAVTHWWLEHNNLGQLSTISDNLLWLPFILGKYLNVTGDYAFLDGKIDILKPFKIPQGRLDEARILDPKTSFAEQAVTVYEHAKRAMDLKLTQMGAHGLPLIGKGDWNDGLDRMGHMDRGESVWLAFFLYTNLIQFADIAEKYGKTSDAERYRDKAQELKRNIDLHAWNGKYYVRGFSDDGKVVDFCDVIVQSWAEISNGSDPVRAEKAVKYAVKHLYKPKEKMILLFDRILNKETWAGALARYALGIRENAAQYTHGATWLVTAFIKLLHRLKADLDKKDNELKETLTKIADKPFNILTIANYLWVCAVLFYKTYSYKKFAGKLPGLMACFSPMEHADPLEHSDGIVHTDGPGHKPAVNYGGEPYGVPADIYGGMYWEMIVPRLIGYFFKLQWGQAVELIRYLRSQGYDRKGQVGWTMYSGCSSWIYSNILKYVLGFDKGFDFENGDTVRINPTIPNEWGEYEYEYPYFDIKNGKTSNYKIKIFNPHHVFQGVEKIEVDGKPVENPQEAIKLVADGMNHSIVVTMGPELFSLRKALGDLIKVLLSNLKLVKQVKPDTGDKPQSIANNPLIADLRRRVEVIKEQLTTLTEDLGLEPLQAQAKTVTETVIEASKESLATAALTSGVPVSRLTKQELLDEYFKQRELITEIIIKLRNYLSANPDASLEEIGVIGKDVQELTAQRAVARFSAGIAKYLSERKKVKQLAKIADRAGIKDGQTLLSKDILQDPAKKEFFSGILGFIPKRVKITFLPDTVSFLLDQDSYAYMNYLRKKLESKEDIGPFTQQNKKLFLDSTGLSNVNYIKNYNGMDIKGLFIFESEGSPNIERTKVHELQHRFYRAYGDGEVSQALGFDKTELDDLIARINRETNSEAKDKLIDELIHIMELHILSRIQSEMISKVMDGKWVRIKNISGWVKSYKNDILSSITAQLSGLNDKALIGRIARKASVRPEAMVKKYKPVIDEIIKYKTKLIMDKEGIDALSALKKANEWAATFLQTIPITKFDRLEGYKDVLRKQAGWLGKGVDLAVLDILGKAPIIKEALGDNLAVVSTAIAKAVLLNPDITKISPENIKEDQIDRPVRYDGKIINIRTYKGKLIQSQTEKGIAGLATLEPDGVTVSVSEGFWELWGNKKPSEITDDELRVAIKHEINETNAFKGGDKGFNRDLEKARAQIAEELKNDAFASMAVEEIAKNLPPKNFVKLYHTYRMSLSGNDAEAELIMKAESMVDEAVKTAPFIVPEEIRAVINSIPGLNLARNTTTTLADLAKLSNKVTKRTINSVPEEKLKMLYYSDTFDEKFVDNLKKEFVSIVEFLSGLPPSITSFGSARSLPNDPDYAITKNLGRIVYETFKKNKEGKADRNQPLSEIKALPAVKTGGGPAMMQAFLEGFYEAAKKDGMSDEKLKTLIQAIRVKLPFEQKPNEIVRHGRWMLTSTFAGREWGLCMNNYGLFSQTGGLGTVWELLEVLFRQQPIVFTSFWIPFIKTLEEIGFIEPLKGGFEGTLVPEARGPLDAQGREVRVLGSYRTTNAGTPLSVMGNNEDATLEAGVRFMTNTGYVPELPSLKEISKEMDELGKNISELRTWGKSLTFIGGQIITQEEMNNTVTLIKGLLKKRTVRIANLELLKALKASLTAEEFEQIQVVTLVKDPQDIPAGLLPPESIVTKSAISHQILINENVQSFVFLPGNEETMRLWSALLVFMETGKAPVRPIISVNAKTDKGRLWEWNEITRIIEKIMFDDREKTHSETIAKGDTRRAQVAQTNNDVNRLIKAGEDQDNAKEALIQFVNQNNPELIEHIGLEDTIAAVRDAEIEIVARGPPSIEYKGRSQRVIKISKNTAAALKNNPSKISDKTKKDLSVVLTLAHIKAKYKVNIKFDEAASKAPLELLAKVLSGEALIYTDRLNTAIELVDKKEKATKEKGAPQLTKEEEESLEKLFAEIDDRIPAIGKKLVSIRNTLNFSQKSEEFDALEIKIHNVFLLLALSDAIRNKSNTGGFPVSAIIFNKKTGDIIARKYRDKVSVTEPERDRLGTGGKQYFYQHAEQTAILAAKAKGFTDWEQASIVSSQEPCKNCAWSIINHGFSSCIYGNKDASPTFLGFGKIMLQQGAVWIYKAEQSLIDLAEKMMAPYQEGVGDVHAERSLMRIYGEDERIHEVILTGVSKFLSLDESGKRYGKMERVFKDVVRSLLNLPIGKIANEIKRIIEDKSMVDIAYSMAWMQSQAGTLVNKMLKKENLLAEGEHKQVYALDPDFSVYDTVKGTGKQTVGWHIASRLPNMCNLAEPWTLLVIGTGKDADRLLADIKQELERKVREVKHKKAEWETDPEHKEKLTDREVQFLSLIQPEIMFLDIQDDFVRLLNEEKERIAQANFDEAPVAERNEVKAAVDARKARFEQGKDIYGFNKESGKNGDALDIFIDAHMPKGFKGGLTAWRGSSERRKLIDGIGYIEATMSESVIEALGKQFTGITQANLAQAVTAVVDAMLSTSTLAGEVQGDTAMGLNAAEKAAILAKLKEPDSAFAKAVMKSITSFVSPKQILTLTIEDLANIAAHAAWNLTHEKNERLTTITPLPADIRQEIPAVPDTIQSHFDQVSGMRDKASALPVINNDYPKFKSMDLAALLESFINKENNGGALLYALQDDFAAFCLENEKSTMPEALEYWEVWQKRLAKAVNAVNDKHQGTVAALKQDEKIPVLTIQRGGKQHEIKLFKNHIVIDPKMRMAQYYLQGIKYAPTSNFNLLEEVNHLLVIQNKRRNVRTSWCSRNCVFCAVNTPYLRETIEATTPIDLEDIDSKIKEAAEAGIKNIDILGEDSFDDIESLMATLDACNKYRINNVHITTNGLLFLQDPEKAREVLEDIKSRTAGIGTMTIRLSWDNEAVKTIKTWKKFGNNEDAVFLAMAQTMKLLQEVLGLKSVKYRSTTDMSKAIARGEIDFYQYERILHEMVHNENGYFGQYRLTVTAHDLDKEGVGASFFSKLDSTLALLESSSQMYEKQKMPFTAFTYHSGLTPFFQNKRLKHLSLPFDKIVEKLKAKSRCILNPTLDFSTGLFMPCDTRRESRLRSRPITKRTISDLIAQTIDDPLGRHLYVWNNVSLLDSAKVNLYNSQEQNIQYARQFRIAKYFFPFLSSLPILMGKAGSYIESIIFPMDELMTKIDLVYLLGDVMAHLKGKQEENYTFQSVPAQLLPLLFEQDVLLGHLYDQNPSFRPIIDKNTGPDTDKLLNKSLEEFAKRLHKSVDELTPEERLQADMEYAPVAEWAEIARIFKYKSLAKLPVIGLLFGLIYNLRLNRFLDAHPQYNDKEALKEGLEFIEKKVVNAAVAALGKEFKGIANLSKTVYAVVAALALSEKDKELIKENLGVSEGENIDDALADMVSSSITSFMSPKQISTLTIEGLANIAAHTVWNLTHKPEERLSKPQTDKTVKQVKPGTGNATSPTIEKEILYKQASNAIEHLNALAGPFTLNCAHYAIETQRRIGGSSRIIKVQEKGAASYHYYVRYGEWIIDPSPWLNAWDKFIVKPDIPIVLHKDDPKAKVYIENGSIPEDDDILQPLEQIKFLERNFKGNIPNQTVTQEEQLTKQQTDKTVKQVKPDTGDTKINLRVVLSLGISRIKQSIIYSPIRFFAVLHHNISIWFKIVFKDTIKELVHTTSYIIANNKEEAQSLKEKTVQMTQMGQNVVTIAPITREEAKQEKGRFREITPDKETIGINYLDKPCRILQELTKAGHGTSVVTLYVELPEGVSAIEASALGEIAQQLIEDIAGSPIYSQALSKHLPVKYSRKASKLKPDIVFGLGDIANFIQPKPENLDRENLFKDTLFVAINDKHIKAADVIISVKEFMDYEGLKGLSAKDLIIKYIGPAYITKSIESVMGRYAENIVEVENIDSITKDQLGRAAEKADKKPVVRVSINNIKELPGYEIEPALSAVSVQDLSAQLKKNMKKYDRFYIDLRSFEGFTLADYKKIEGLFKRFPDTKVLFALPEKLAREEERALIEKSLKDVSNFYLERLFSSDVAVPLLAEDKVYYRVEGENYEAAKKLQKTGISGFVINLNEVGALLQEIVSGIASLSKPKDPVEKYKHSYLKLGLNFFQKRKIPQISLKNEEMLKTLAVSIFKWHEKNEPGLIEEIMNMVNNPDNDFDIGELYRLKLKLQYFYNNKQYDELVGCLRGALEVVVKDAYLPKGIRLKQDRYNAVMGTFILKAFTLGKEGEKILEKLAEGDFGETGLDAKINQQNTITVITQEALKDSDRIIKDAVLPESYTLEQLLEVLFLYYQDQREFGFKDMPQDLKTSFIKAVQAAG